MKLKNLLKFVPEGCMIGITDVDEDNFCILRVGKVTDAFFNSNKTASVLPKHVKNMSVISIHPGSNIYMPSVVMLGGSNKAIDLCVKVELQIKVVKEKY